MANTTQQRETVLRYFKASGDAELAAQLLDLAESPEEPAVQVSGSWTLSCGQNVAEIVAANFPEYPVEMGVASQNAERQKAAFIAEDFYGQPDFVSRPRKCSGIKRHYDIGHRDVLRRFKSLTANGRSWGYRVHRRGARMNGYPYDFVLSNLTKIGAATVK